MEDESKPFASLSSALLARKGGAKPALRPALSPLAADDTPPASPIDVDTAWQAEVVPITRMIDAPAADSVRHQQERVVASFAEAPARVAKPRRQAFARGGKAAFTLRLDEDRHLRLRLACTASNRSAQQVVTEALDRLLADSPELDAMATELRRKRSY